MTSAIAVLGSVFDWDLGYKPVTDDSGNIQRTLAK